MGLLAAVAVLLLTAGPASAAASRAIQNGHDPFPSSVASGDPRPDSVILWTRVDSLTDEEPKLLTVEVAADEAFTTIVSQRQIAASGENDYCTKVRISGLDPHTTYYYRFLYQESSSPIGKTRTAPDPGVEQPVRFAVAYCQDYIGRYYNAYLKMLLDHDDDIDFVVFLGDYVYETTGDPSFQSPSPGRSITFDDVDGAIQLGSPGQEYYAAQSLANYRTLYRTYRSDPILQQVHERWPMIVIWDDHEFANDSWQANATYSNGREDELEPERRRNAERAFLEWIPIEVGIDDEGEMEIDSSILYPNSRIYRHFQEGSLLDLVLTDYRTYRPDHLVPEDAFPGTVVLDQATLIDLLGPDTFDALKASFDPYVDMRVFRGVVPIMFQTSVLVLAQALRLENPALDTAAAVHLAQDRLDGLVSVRVLDSLFAAADLAEPIPAELTAGLPRGVSYALVGKRALYSSTGSRYMVLSDTYNLLATAAFVATAGERENVYGGQQDAWLQGVLTSSPTAWRVLASSTSMAPMVLDFSNPTLAGLLPPGFPDELRTRLTLNVDQWDGFPLKRQLLLGLLGLASNSVIISGDIHATFVTDHGSGVFELTPPAISSATFGSLVASTVDNDPLLGNIPGIDQLIPMLNQMLQISSLDDARVSPSDILYTNVDRHGFMIVDVTADSMVATIEEIPEAETFVSYYDHPEDLDALFQTTTFTISSGEITQAQP